MSTIAATQKAKALGLRRALKWHERSIAWLIIALLVAIATAALVVVAFRGKLASIDPDVFAPVLRGYTGHGELLGFVAAAAALVSVLFSIRKRWLQERFPLFKGTMVGWLWVHVFAGFVALWAAALHAGYGLLDVRPTSGKVLFWVLVIVALTGTLWRLVYRFVPSRVVSKIGNYSREASHQRAEEQATEIEKVAAGGSELLHQWKDWLLQQRRTSTELAQARQNFAQSPEAPVFEQLCALAESRNRALEREQLQARAARRLQWWRVLHVPLSLLFVVGIPVHLLEVYDVPAKQLPPAARKELTALTHLTGAHSAKACGECHQAIYEQWKHSMHAHALSSPVTIAQNNQVMRHELAEANVPDPKRICVNCHSPIATELAQAEMLPFDKDPTLQQGITCMVCHQLTGPSSSGGGAYTDGVLGGLERGRVMYGPYAGAVGNPYHQSRFSPVLAGDAATICQNCHDVNFDRDKNGRIEFGHDLVLQTTYQEYVEYRKQGGAGSCVECHMPVMSQTRAAEAASIPEQQDTHAPPRIVRDHSFVGVDYPIDVPGSEDPHRPTRVALLRAAARFELSEPKVDETAGRASASVRITNVGAGHNLPSGFAFARQMWVEFTAEDDSGRVLFSSGKLAKNTDDLCDAGTFDDENSPIRKLVQGCKKSDPQLVNFQKKLVDKATVEKDAQGNPVKNERGELIPAAASDASEQSIQRVAGNPITRKRPSDGQAMGSIEPNQSRSFNYTWKVPAGVRRMTVTARLLFRNLPPYFVRNIAKEQPADESPQLAPMVQNLDIVEMAVSRRKIEVSD